MVISNLVVDIMVFACHMTLQDHVIKALYDFMVGSTSRRHNEDITVLDCQAILQDHVIKVSCDFMGRSTSKQFTILQRLVAITTLVVEL